MSRKASRVLGMVSGVENPEARKVFPSKCMQHDERGGLMDFKILDSSHGPHGPHGPRLDRAHRFDIAADCDEKSRPTLAHRRL